MKKIFMFVLVAMMFVPVFSVPTITVLTSPPGAGDLRIPWAIESLKIDYPDVIVDVLNVNLADGSTLSMDAMLAAGTPPNVYIDTMVRASKYMIPEFALPLNGFIRDLDKYRKGVLEPYSRNGKILALPQPGGAQGMCINLDIMKDIGFVVKDDWTIDDFMKMAQLVKDKYNGKKFATGMFAANQSGDYLLHNWFPAFGAQYYVNGNYDKSVIADTGGAKVYAFYQTLVKNGFVPPNSATLNDDDYAATWAEGKFAATAFFPGWCAGYLQTAIEQKMIDKPFEYKFVPFPRGPGVKSVGTYISNGAFIVHKTGNDIIDRISARLVEYANGKRAQEYAVSINNVSIRIDVAQSTNIRQLEVASIASKNGIYDAGLTDPRFTERRSAQYPILQKVLTFKMTPDQAIQEYQRQLSAVK
jgi:ABC-type glycerol-3-phosphate transport system substrate-binding protein